MLQDPGLAFHPPFLYLGYVGFSVAFAFAVAALIEGRVDAAWARWVRPWTLASWCALTIGIAMGSWWAYYTLGWGGWWFWDPVENASFMPWLVGTALIHSSIVVEKRDTLKAWTILLAIITFSLSLVGTFLVRSGVLTSVHAFATDPERGTFILLLLVTAIGGSLTLYAFRAPALKGGGLFAPISREGALVLNNLLLSCGCATVFLGTLYPLFLDAMNGPKLSVGFPFFNRTFAPMMVPMIIAVGIGPMLAWKRGDLLGALQRLWVAYIATALVVLVAFYVTYGGPVLAVLGFGLAAWLAAAGTDRVRRTHASVPRALRRDDPPRHPPPPVRLRHDLRALRPGGVGRRLRRLGLRKRGDRDPQTRRHHRHRRIPTDAGGRDPRPRPELYRRRCRDPSDAAAANSSPSCTPNAGSSRCSNRPPV